MDTREDIKRCKGEISFISFLAVQEIRQMEQVQAQMAVE